MASSIDDILKSAIGTGDSETISRELRKLSKEYFTEEVLENICDDCNQLICNNNFNAIKVIIEYFYSINVNHLDVLFIKHLYCNIAIYKPSLLDRVWYELNFSENTYLMAHSALGMSLRSIDNPMVFETMIKHIRESNIFHEEEDDFDTWILDSVLVNGCINCLNKTIQMFPNMEITVQNLYSSIMGGSVECFKLVYGYHCLNHTISHNIMLELAAAYGGLPILAHLMVFYQVDQPTIKRMFAHALACGRKDTFCFIHNTLNARNYIVALKHARIFRNQRKNKILECMGYEFDYHEKKWFISHDYERNYKECVRLILHWRSSE